MALPGMGKRYFSDLRSWAPWLIGVLIAILAIAVGKQVVKRYSIQREAAMYKRNIELQQTRRQELSELLKYAQTPAYSEEQARLKFGLAKPGERLAIIPETMPTDETADNSVGGEPTHISNYQKWWHYFFVYSR